MYIDSYEIEFKLPGGNWESVGHVYPRYKWKVVRTWYLLHRPRIVNDSAVEALLARRTAVSAALVHCLFTNIGYRVWRWERRGWKLRKVLECKGHCEENLSS